MSENASRIQLVRYLLAMENGEFFNKRTGLLNQSLGLQYLKTEQWKIEPNLRSSVPDDLNFQLPQNTETIENQFYSVDGEKYPLQNVSGKVLK